MCQILDGKLAMIDFGLCAKVPLPDARTLTLSIVHMMQGDMAGMIEDAIELDFLPRDVDKPRLEKVIVFFHFQFPARSFFIYFH